MTLLKRGASFLGEHNSEDLLQCHDVAAGLPFGEEVTGTMPFLAVITGYVGAMLPSEIHIEIPDGDSISLPGVAMSLLNLTNQVRTHQTSLLP